MANCRWKLGCIIYWGVVFCSIAILITLHIQRQDVVPTDSYITCVFLVKANFSVIIFYGLVALAFTKSRPTHVFMPIVIVILSIGLLVLSPYTLFYVETLKFPKMEEAVAVLTKRFSIDPNVLNYIQSQHKCCGLRNYTDWYSIIPEFDKKRISPRQGTPPLSPGKNIRSIRSTCCRRKDACDNYEESSSELDGNNKTGAVLLEDLFFPQGCYIFVKENFLRAYKSLRFYATIALIFILATALVFSYMWWRKTATAPEARCWPAPPLTVQTAVYNPKEGFVVAYVNPFMGSVDAAEDEHLNAQDSDCLIDEESLSNNNNPDVAGSRADGSIDENSRNLLRDPPIKIVSIV